MYTQPAIFYGYLWKYCRGCVTNTSTIWWESLGQGVHFLASLFPVFTALTTWKRAVLSYC